MRSPNTLYLQDPIHAIVVDDRLFDLIERGLLRFSPRVALDPNEVGKFVQAMEIVFVEATPDE